MNSKYYELQSKLNESICLNEKPSLDIFLEMLEIKINSDEYNNTLLENFNITKEFNEYFPLLESIDIINDTKKDIQSITKNESDVNIFNKFVKPIKKLLIWWYKIEPDKKFKTLHLVLNILVNVLLFIVSIFISGKITKSVKNTKLVSNIPDKSIKLPLLKNPLSIKSILIMTIIDTALNYIYNFLSKLLNKLEYNINKDDLDKNIKKFDESIEKINKQLDNEKLSNDVREKLISDKDKISNCLSKLIKLKERNKK